MSIMGGIFGIISLLEVIIFFILLNQDKEIGNILNAIADRIRGRKP